MSSDRTAPVEIGRSHSQSFPRSSPYDAGKVRRLADALGLRRWEIVGLLESLAHFARDYCKGGALGRWTAADIAEHIEWDRTTPAALFAALADTGWVDGPDLRLSRMPLPPAQKTAATHRRRARKRAGGAFVTSTDLERVADACCHRCAYCHRPRRRLQVDHVEPLAKGGRDEPGNLVMACPACNARKGARPVLFFHTGFNLRKAVARG